ncbi:MAG TPA: hypothetical protein VEB59_16310 [Gemmatimonadales bacterium]|nr:hypothetical protein [Gemmatimonadales bacterium]
MLERVTAVPGAGFAAAESVVPAVPAVLRAVSGVTADTVSVADTAGVVSVAAVATVFESAGVPAPRSPPQAAATDSRIRAGANRPRERLPILRRPSDDRMGERSFHEVTHPEPDARQWMNMSMTRQPSRDDGHR